MNLNCPRCGKKVDPYHYGEINSVRYCHTDEDYPTCYMRESWARAGELSPRIKDLLEDPAQR